MIFFQTKTIGKTLFQKKRPLDRFKRNRFVAWTLLLAFLCFSVPGTGLHFLFPCLESSDHLHFVGCCGSRPTSGTVVESRSQYSDSNLEISEIRSFVSQTANGSFESVRRSFERLDWDQCCPICLFFLNYNGSTLSLFRIASIQFGEFNVPIVSFFLAWNFVLQHSARAPPIFPG